MIESINIINKNEGPDTARCLLRSLAPQWRVVVFFLVFGGVFLAAPQQVAAVARTWDGGGGDNNWSTAANWSGDTVPTSADSVTFDATSTKDAVWDTSGPATILSLDVTSDYSGDFSITKTSVTVSGGWTWSGTGTFSAGTGTVTLGTNGVYTLTPGTAQFYNLILSSETSSCTITLAASVTVINNLTSAKPSGYVCSLNGFKISAGGNIDFSGNGAISGTTVIEANGAGNQTLSSTGGGIWNNVTINKPSGTLTLSGTILVAGAWTWTAGSIAAGTSTLSLGVSTSAVTPGPAEYYNVLFAAGASHETRTFSGDMTVTNNLTLAKNSGHTFALNGSTIKVRGNLDFSGTGDLTGTTVVEINGAGNQTLSSTGGGIWNNVTINKPSGTLTLSGTIPVAGNWTWTAGKLDAGASTIQVYVRNGVNTTFTPGSGTYYDITRSSYAGGSPVMTLGGDLRLSHTLTIAGHFFTTNNYAITTGNLSVSGGILTLGSSVVKISGDFTHSSGTFSQGTSTVVLNGTNQTVTGTTTFYNLYKLLPANTTDTLTFTHTTTYTIASGGAARFIGTRGYPLSIQSSLAGSAFTLTKTGSIVAEYVNLKDCTVSVATSAPASTDVSGNTNWTFTTEFVSTIRASGGDYTTLSGWESAVQADLTAATTKVFGHGGITGTIADNTAVSGATSLATGTAVHATSTQILIKSISGTFQSGEQIRVDGSNYVTSSDAGNGAIAVAEAYNDWPNALNDSVTLSGWTTDADNFILITVPDTESHNGKLKDTASDYYRGFTLNPSAQVVPLTNSQNYTRIIGIAVDGTGGFINNNIDLGGSVNILDRCLSANSHNDGIVAAAQSIITNSVTYGNLNIGISFNFPEVGALSYNNTVQGNAVGIYNYSTANRVTVKNTLASGNTTDFQTGSNTMTVMYSASSDVTADDFGVTGNRVSQTFSFVDAANKDFHLAPKDAGARNYGTDLLSDGTYPIVGDIDGNTRPTVNPSDTNEASYDIGADEADYATVRVKDGIRLKDGVRLK